MSLSLAQSSRKQKFQSDPRNTQWANDTSRFGHQQLIQMGWQPGRGLGASVEGNKEHVKVKIKADSKGLGHSKSQQDLPTGLDVFQRILGKLNGNESEVEEKIQKKQSMSGLYLQFVPGGVLEGTVKSKKELKSARMNQEQLQKKVQKAQRSAERALKKAKKESKKESKKTSKVDSDSKNLSEANEHTTVDHPTKSPVVPATRPRGIRATRNRYIAMKKSATADSQSLKEILML